MKPDISDKHDLIIDAAIRRFSHFGIHKTTLTEIADDVAISKQALAYYFADKQSLIASVVDQIVGQYLQAIESAFTEADSVETGLLQLTEIKKTVFERYYMLYMQTRNADIKVNSAEIIAIKNKVRHGELTLLSDLISKGVASGELRAVDALATSILVLDTLSAFECAMKIEKVLPEHEDFLQMTQKQKEVLHLLVNGMKQGRMAA